MQSCAAGYALTVTSYTPYARLLLVQAEHSAVQ
jgi:hypothetical protein